MVLWVFGYGSLLWRAGFTYEQRVVGYVKDFRRVFYQGNTDHRGTPENPGRCVTLEPKEGSICWGVAYCVSGHDAEQLVLSYLNLREKEYDVRAFIDFYTVESGAKPAISGALAYIGSGDTTSNKYYLGPAPLADMASQIARAVGPSGPNYEYLFRLEESLCEIGCAQEEITELANEVRKLQRETETTLGEAFSQKALSEIASSTGIAKEVRKLLGTPEPTVEEPFSETALYEIDCANEVRKLLSTPEAALEKPFAHKAANGTVENAEQAYTTRQNSEAFAH